MKNEVYTYCRLSEFDSLGEVYGRMVEVDNNTGYTLVVECSEGKLIRRLSVFVSSCKYQLSQNISGDTTPFKTVRGFSNYKYTTVVSPLSYHHGYFMIPQFSKLVRGNLTRLVIFV